MLESESMKRIVLKMQKIKKSRGFKFGNTYNLQELLESQFKKVEEMKEKIINLKLDLLFNYKTEDEALAEISVKIPEFNNSSNFIRNMSLIMKILWGIRRIMFALYARVMK